MDGFQKGHVREGPSPPLSNETVTSQGSKVSRPWFTCSQRLVDAHDVDGGVLVPVDKAVFLASQNTVNFHGPVQNSAPVPSLEDAGHDFAALTATL